MSATSNIRVRRATHDKENPFYMTARVTAQDKTLSYDALGMLNYLLSKSDNWEVIPSDLERKGCGRNKVYNTLNELIAAGHIERVYHRDDKARITKVEYIVHEKTLLPTKQEMEKQEVENPEMENGYSNTDKRLKKKQTVQDTEKKDTPLPVPELKFPATYKYRDWTKEHMDAYQSLHATGIESLFAASGDMFKELKEAPKVYALKCIEALDELTRCGYSPVSFAALGVYARSHKNWRDEGSPLDIVNHIPDFERSRNGQLQTPDAPELSEADQFKLDTILKGITRS